ncbi:MAG: zinc ribbon domain-containing protein [Nitrospirota bacterium]
MFCPKCGSEIGKGDRFCSNCGTMIEEGISASPSIGVAGKQNLPLIGGAFLLLSFFMPWIDLGFISVSGFNLLKAASGAEKLLALIAWFVPIGGGITAYLAYTKIEIQQLHLLLLGQLHFLCGFGCFLV